MTNPCKIERIFKHKVLIFQQNFSFVRALVMGISTRKYQRIAMYKSIADEPTQWSLERIFCLDSDLMHNKQEKSLSTKQKTYLFGKKKFDYRDARLENSVRIASRLHLDRAF